MSLRPAWVALLTAACSLGAAEVALKLSLWPAVAVGAFAAALALAEGVAEMVMAHQRAAALEQQETRLVALEASVQKVAGELAALSQAQSLNRMGGPW